MKVHGNVVITRRDGVLPESDYKKYRPLLKEDFKRICGYCGKVDSVTRKGFEIDHFVPIDIDDTRETDYSNLVYCCFTCNRKKSKKWPTNDPARHNDGERGFVDPVDVEFHNHLKRDETGKIIWLTKIGQYMHQKVFKFNVRPTEKIWQIMVLEGLKRDLLELRKTKLMSADQLDEYIEIDSILMDLLEHIGGE